MKYCGSCGRQLIYAKPNQAWGYTYYTCSDNNCRSYWINIPGDFSPDEIVQGSKRLTDEQYQKLMKGISIEK